MGSCAESRGTFGRGCRGRGGVGYRGLLPLAAACLLQAACIDIDAAPNPAAPELSPSTSMATFPDASPEIGLAQSGLAMEVEAEPAMPYPQSRVRYLVRILARVPLRQATLSEPVAEHAIIRRIGDDRRFDLERDGVRYRVLERLYAVVPQRPGPLRIVAPRLSAAVPATAMPGGRQAQTGLDSVLERRETVTRTGPTLLLDVRPIPAAAERPWLAAESVSISEHWEPSEARVRVGESITRTIEIEASGLIGASVPDLPTESPTGFRAYPRTAEIDERVSGDDLFVTARIRRSYVPTEAGELALPAVRLPWWSIGMDEQREARLPERRLRVDGAAPAAASAAADQQARASFVRDAASDLWAPSWLAVLFALAWLITLWLWLRERRGRQLGRQPAASLQDAESSGESGPRGTKEQVSRFKRACVTADARAARAALLAWGRGRWPGRAPAGPLDLMERLDASPAAVRAALSIERGLYARQASDWDGKSALAAITPWLEEASHGRSAAEQPSLPPLYPDTAEGAGRRDRRGRDDAR